jgi:hypothetical protein
VGLRQALDAAREEVTLARGRLALVEHRASGAQEAFRAVAELLRGEMTPKVLPRLVARITEVIAPHAVSASKRWSGASTRLWAPRHGLYGPHSRA